MALLRAMPASQLDTRVCVGCGYRGKELQGDLHDTDYACPVCEEDLYARPPMSYLEMEGFHAAQSRDVHPCAQHTHTRRRRARTLVKRILIAESAIIVGLVATVAIVFTL